MKEEHIVSSITFMIMTGGVMANVYALIIAGKMSSMNSSFGIITKNQEICNLLMCLLFLFYVCPMQLTDFEPFVKFSKYIGLAAMIIYEASMNLHLIIACNRLFAVFLPFHYDQLFTNYNTKFMVAFSWLIGLFICTLFYFILGCHFFYSDTSFTFGFRETRRCTKITWYSDFMLNNSLVMVTLVFNLLTAYKAGTTSRSMLQAAGSSMSKQLKRRERNFLRQSFFQGLSMFAGQLTYYLTAPLVDSKIIVFLLASLWAFVHAFEGGIILLTNKDVRIAAHTKKLSVTSVFVIAR